MWLSDISGTFDRVDTKKLLTKMRRLCICDTLITFFEYNLTPISARVAVDLAESFAFVLLYMGLSLSKHSEKKKHFCFAGVHKPADRNNAKERRFAYDLNLSKQYATSANKKI